MTVYQHLSEFLAGSLLHRGNKKISNGNKKNHMQGKTEGILKVYDNTKLKNTECIFPSCEFTDSEYYFKRY